jgi:hypothetical protein
MANQAGAERVQSSNYLMGGVSRSEAIMTPEKKQESFDKNEQQSTHSRTETVPTGVGDRSPNVAIQAMGGEKGSADPGVQSMLAGVSFGSAPERQAASVSESGAGTGAAGLAGGAGEGGGMGGERAAQAASGEGSVAGAGALGMPGEGLPPGGGGRGAGPAGIGLQRDFLPPGERGLIGGSGARSGVAGGGVFAASEVTSTEAASTHVDKLTALDASRVMPDAERLKPGSIPIERTDGLAAATSDRASLIDMNLLDQSWSLRFNGPKKVKGLPNLDDPSAPTPGTIRLSANSIFINAQESHLLKFEDAGKGGVLDQANALELLSTKLGVTVPDFKVLGDEKQLALLMTNMPWVDSTSPGLSERQKIQADAIVSVAAKTLSRNGYGPDLHRGNWGVSREAVKSGKPITTKDVIIFDPVVGA